jgi:hypothetical protein
MFVTLITLFMNKELHFLKNQQYNRLIDGDATLPWCSQIDVPVDDEAPVVTSGISRSIGTQSSGDAHRSRVCVCVFIGVSVSV